MQFGFSITKGTYQQKEALNFSLHVGADADMTNKISVKIDTMDTAGLGIKGLNQSIMICYVMISLTD